MGLERVRRRSARLGDPQRRFAAVQIAGTNGKGSTAAMTEAILRAAGLRTGLYTSPHLARFTERIRVGRARGRRRSAGRARRARRRDRRPADLLRDRDGARRSWRSPRRRVEIAVLETGLGGRLDAVTTCEPLATAITSIGIDHTDYLGDDARRRSPREKAGHPQTGRPLLPGRAFPPRPHREIAAPGRRRSARRSVASGATSRRRPGRSGSPGRTSATTPRSPWRWRARRPQRSVGRSATPPIAEALARTSLARPAGAGRAGPAARLRAQRRGRPRAGGRAARRSPPAAASCFLMSVAEDKDPRAILARAGPRRPRAGRHPLRQPAGAAPPRRWRVRGGAVLRPAGGRRRSDRRARRGPAARGRRPGGRLRLDVPGRPAAGPAAGRAGRSAAHVGPAVAGASCRR